LIFNIGGQDNIKDIDNCKTRIRLSIYDNNLIQDLSKLEKYYPYFLSNGKLQIITGNDTIEFINELNNYINGIIFIKELITLIGGISNIQKLDACKTRLRISLVDHSIINQSLLTKFEKDYYKTYIFTTQLHIITGKNTEKYL